MLTIHLTKGATTTATAPTWPGTDFCKQPEFELGERHKEVLGGVAGGDDGDNHVGGDDDRDNDDDGNDVDGGDDDCDDGDYDDPARY